MSATATLSNAGAFAFLPTMHPRPSAVYRLFGRRVEVAGAETLPDVEYPSSEQGANQHILVEDDPTEREAIEIMIKHYPCLKKYSFTMVPTRERAFALNEAGRKQTGKSPFVSIIENERVISFLHGLLRIG